MKTLLMTTLCSASLLIAGQQMNVAVCNLGNVSGPVIAGAKAETELVYRSAGVTIVWHDCEAFPPSAGETNGPWFIIRLRTDKPPLTVGPTSLDVMGKAFVEDSGGYMADAYFQSIQATSERHHAESSVLLGFVMAHELGGRRAYPGWSDAGSLGPKTNGRVAPTLAEIQRTERRADTGCA